MGNLEHERLHENLKTLGMLRTGEVLDNYLEVAAKEELSVIQILDYLIAQELDDKLTRRMRFRSRIARFPYQKTLEEFNFSFQPSIDKKTIQGLASLKFAHHAENVVFLGPPGVGKTHLAIALGMVAVKDGLSTYFTTAADLIDDLKLYASQGRLKERLKKLCRYQVLIVDEIGYLPMERKDANLIFQLVSRRYERSSLILTSNKPFKEWGEAFL